MVVHEACELSIQLEAALFCAIVPLEIPKPIHVNVSKLQFAKCSYIHAS